MKSKLQGTRYKSRLQIINFCCIYYCFLQLYLNFFQEKNKDDIPKERRPFSREIDLQCNKFDDAQKQSILKKASQLNNRFSQGESRFL